MQNNFDDLNKPGACDLVEKWLNEDIENYCRDTYDSGHRDHLGASLIGHECKRYLWYMFRWVKHVKHDGRTQRLFNRGHREEERFIEWLEGIGCQVWADDLQNNKLFFNLQSKKYWIANKSEYEKPEFKNVNCDSDDVTNDKISIAAAKAQGVKLPQYRIIDCDGHFGGSLDGIVKLPERYGIKKPCLLEFKTSGTGSKFDNLFKKGMQIEKPQHFYQTCAYGLKYGFEFVVYLCINKNDDRLYIEVVKLRPDVGKQMIHKANQIITSQEAPPKLAESETYFKCKFCDMRDICHKGAATEVNCRSCKNAKPIENGQWFCNVYNSIIPKEAIKDGCKENYKAITDKVQ